METRANHVVIGAFVLVVVAGLFGFVVWLAKVEIDREFALYRVFFDEAVSGLSVGGDVRYNGIPVGTVTAIEIARGDPGRVQVTVEVSRDTPVRSDTVAKLELQGITGVAFIQLQGGSPSAPPPGPAKDGLPPVIQSERSAIQELFAGAPELINRIITLVSEMTLMVNEDNRRAIASILANVEDLSGRLVKRGPELEQVIVDVRNTTTALRETTSRINQLLVRADALVDSADATLATARGTLSGADELMEGELRQTLRDFDDAAKQFSQLGRDIGTLVADNREGLTAFSNDGLLELTRFLEEARLLVASTARLVEDLQSDPAQFLFGGQQGGFETE